MAENNAADFDDEFPLEFLINSPIVDLSILDLPDDNELFSEAFFHTSKITSCSGSIEPIYTYEEGSLGSIILPYNRSFNAMMELQPRDTHIRESMDCLQEPTAQFLRIGEEQQQQQQQLEQVVVMETAIDDMLGNGDQQYNEYSINTMANLFKVSVAPPLHPQQSFIQPIYDGKERFLQPMSSAIITGYSNLDASISGLYQEGMGLSTCSGGQWQGCYSGGIVPMTMPMPMPLPEMEYNMQDSFQLNGYDSTNMQILGNINLQQQQPLQNNSLVAGCSSTTPLVYDMSTFDRSTFKIGRISAEERKEKINRYMKKRNQRNFSKKIKYTRRKTLADSRPRVRGRFAKNDELGETARTSRSSTSNFD